MLLLIHICTGLVRVLSIQYNNRDASFDLKKMATKSTLRKTGEIPVLFTFTLAIYLRSLILRFCSIPVVKVPRMLVLLYRAVLFPNPELMYPSLEKNGNLPYGTI